MYQCFSATALHQDLMLFEIVIPWPFPEVSLLDNVSDKQLHWTVFKMCVLAFVC